MGRLQSKEQPSSRAPPSRLRGLAVKLEDDVSLG
jgi:hypothetical protein